MKLFRVAVVVFCTVLLSSCSVYMAAHQPGKKDMTAIKPGVHQSVVRTELGTPVWCGKENGCNIEIYRFTQGYSQGAKAGRAVFHGAADVLTLGLWEVPAKRRRIKTVMQELIYLAARLVKTGRRLKLVFSRHCPAFEAFLSIHTRFTCG